MTRKKKKKEWMGEEERKKEIGSLDDVLQFFCLEGRRENVVATGISRLKEVLLLFVYMTCQ